MSKKRRLLPFRGDRSLWIIISVMLVISLLVIYSSTVSMAHKDVHGDTSYYMIRQAKFILFSFIVMFFVHWIDFKVYAKYSRTIFYVAVMLVLSTFFLGESRNDATRWIPVPFFGRFQPSEMLKMSLMVLLAVQLGQRSSIISSIPILPSFSRRSWRLHPQLNGDILSHTTIPLVMPIVVACVVIFPMNLSTAAMLFLVAMVLFVVARVRLREIMRLVMLAVVGLSLVMSVMIVFKVGRAQTWLSRIENYAAPIMGYQRVDNEKDGAENFQRDQAQIAIASGGLFGKGPGNSTQRSQLPHPYSDFAYAFIIEEYGVMGGVVIFLLFLWVFYRAGVIVRRCRNATTALLVMGLSLSITVQAFVNMLVCVGIFPVTGQPLPLISMGGSSVLFTCISFGIILSVSRQNDADELESIRIATGEALPETESELQADALLEHPQDQYEADLEAEAEAEAEEEEEEEAVEPIRSAPKESPQAAANQVDDDFPFTVVQRNDNTIVTDTKVKKDVIDLY